MQQRNLVIHPKKSKIVFCKDSNRKGSYENIQFTFLGYTFKPRYVKGLSNGIPFTGFTPAVSNDALKEMRRRIRDYCLHRRTDTYRSNRLPVIGTLLSVGGGIIMGNFTHQKCVVPWITFTRN